MGALASLRHYAYAYFGGLIFGRLMDRLYMQPMPSVYQQETRIVKDKLRAFYARMGNKLTDEALLAKLVQYVRSHLLKYEATNAAAFPQGKQLHTYLKDQAVIKNLLYLFTEDYAMCPYCACFFLSPSLPGHMGLHDSDSDNQHAVSDATKWRANRHNYALFNEDTGEWECCLCHQNFPGAVDGQPIITHLQDYHSDRQLFFMGFAAYLTISHADGVEGLFLDTMMRGYKKEFTHPDSGCEFDDKTAALQAELLALVQLDRRPERPNNYEQQLLDYTRIWQSALTHTVTSIDAFVEQYENVETLLEQPHLLLPLLQRRLGCILQQCTESHTYVLRGLHSKLTLPILKLAMLDLAKLR